MRNSKRTQNQKKIRQSKRKYQGGSPKGIKDPHDQSKTRNFYVYFNLFYDAELGRDIITRQLNDYELDVIRDRVEVEESGTAYPSRILNEDTMREYDAWRESGAEPRIIDFEVYDVIQLEEPRKGKHFRLSVITKNRTYKQALRSIKKYIKMIGQDSIGFEPPYFHDHINHQSNDQQRYIISYNDIEILDRGITTDEE
jgi:hypothetical protein